LESINYSSERTGTVMPEFHREIRFFEEEIEGYNRRSLDFEDLKTNCDKCGLLLLLEPFPGQGLYFERLGVPVITVDRRLEPWAGAFVGFWGFFLHHLHPGGVRFFRESGKDEDEAHLLASILASVALIPADRLLDALPRKWQEGRVSALLSRAMDLRVQILLHGERVIPSEQVL
jgi:hypothetical protein